MPSDVFRNELKQNFGSEPAGQRITVRATISPSENLASASLALKLQDDAGAAIGSPITSFDATLAGDGTVVFTIPAATTDGRRGRVHWQIQDTANDHVLAAGSIMLSPRF